MILNVLTSMRRSAVSRRRVSSSSTQHVFIYVLGLSVVDLLVVVHLPFLIAELLRGEWLFGTAMCKLYWFGESVNKLLSSFLMTVLSWDRYLAVCSPISSFRMRSNMVAVAVLILCTVLAVVLLLPVLIQAQVVYINRQTMDTVLPEDLLPQDEEWIVTKCIFEGDSSFVMYTFVIGFVLPALFITFFYSQVIYRLQQSSMNMRRHSAGSKEATTAMGSRVQQVTKRIIVVILFYFFCWTPQWTLNLMSQYNLIHPSWITPLLSAIFLGAHVLVCFNSAANPVLYALINRELRVQHTAALNRKRLSVSAATQATVEFVVKHTHKVSTASRRQSSVWSMSQEHRAHLSRFRDAVFGMPIFSSCCTSLRRRLARRGSRRASQCSPLSEQLTAAEQRASKLNGRRVSEPATALTAAEVTESTTPADAFL